MALDHTGHVAGCRELASNQSSLHHSTTPRWWPARAGASRAPDRSPVLAGWPATRDAFGRACTLNEPNVVDTPDLGQVPPGERDHDGAGG